VPNGEERERFAHFSSSYTDDATLHATSLRVDQKLGENLLLFGRYSFAVSGNGKREVARIPA